jgi:hypothetical protein
VQAPSSRGAISGSDKPERLVRIQLGKPQLSANGLLERTAIIRRRIAPLPGRAVAAVMLTGQGALGHPGRAVGRRIDWHASSQTHSARAAGAVRAQ